MQCGDERDRGTRLLEAQSSLGRDRPRGMETEDGKAIEHVVPSVSGSCIIHCGRRGLTHELSRVHTTQCFVAPIKDFRLYPLPC